MPIEVNLTQTIEAVCKFTTAVRLFSEAIQNPYIQEIAPRNTFAFLADSRRTLDIIEQEIKKAMGKQDAI
jgi:hypothetical protein